MSTPSESNASTTSDGPRSANTDDSIISARSRRQLGLFLAGASFCALSALVTRRSLQRRYVATIPRFYQPNSNPRQVNGAAEAAQALGIASLNVFSWTIMMTGGTFWAFDISTIEDLRRKVRGGLGVDGAGKSESEAEEQMEEWLATVLSRKDEKERKKTTAEARDSKAGDQGPSR
ncbi:MAG: hypothetical protein M1820_006678 [Bogoriella megaspora]|nr:MAG: hypothetical protein M1820_006678 [Bogoriella megaspora]